MSTGIGKLYHLLENMNTEEMAKDRAWEFLFAFGTPPITGGVQATSNPFAIRGGADGLSATTTGRRPSQ